MSSKFPQRHKVKCDSTEVKGNKSAPCLLEIMYRQDKWKASEQFITTQNDEFAFT